MRCSMKAPICYRSLARSSVSPIPGLSTLVSACIIAGQLVTIPVAMIAGRHAEAWGLKPLLAVSCFALAVRGVTFAVFDNIYLQVAAQLFEGVAMGIWDVLIPLIIADLVAGSGRYSMSRGVLSTVQGIGGSLSNVAAGGMVMLGGYTVAFAGLSVAAMLAFALVALLPEPAAVKAERARRVRRGVKPDSPA
jgi:hypothetical protein